MGPKTPQTLLYEDPYGSKAQDRGDSRNQSWLVGSLCLCGLLGRAPRSTALRQGMHGGFVQSFCRVDLYKI